jgi:magnesium chelatase subunit I
MATQTTPNPTTIATTALEAPEHTTQAWTTAAFKDILGQEEVKFNIKSALLTKRNILVVGPAGVGKTTLAKNIAALLPEQKVNNCSFHCLPEKPLCPECRTAHKEDKKVGSSTLPGSERFIRVQGSPDLTVEDLIGDIDPVKALKFGPLSMEAFTPGKIFKANNGVLFFDELNRCPEKLQNALLQVLEERQATLGSYDVDLEANFIFIATMNPEDSSTEKLSDVLLDRFDVVYMRYPETHAFEEDIVTQKGKSLGVTVPSHVLRFMIGLVRELRNHPQLEKFPGVRASLGLYERAQANAVLRESKEVSVDDAKQAILSVLSHRIQLKPSAQYAVSPEDFVKKAMEQFLKDHDFESPDDDGVTGVFP